MSSLLLVGGEDPDLDVLVQEDDAVAGGAGGTPRSVRDEVDWAVGHVVSEVLCELPAGETVDVLSAVATTLDRLVHLAILKGSDDTWSRAHRAKRTVLLMVAAARKYPTARWRWT